MFVNLSNIPIKFSKKMFDPSNIKMHHLQTGMFYFFSFNVYTFYVWTLSGLISLIWCIINIYVTTTTKAKIFNSSKVVIPEGSTLTYSLFLPIPDQNNL